MENLLDAEAIFAVLGPFAMAFALVLGRVVGLIFDGNIQSLPNDFLYSEKQARAVSVDVRGILEMLRNAYKATALVRELEAAGK